jgi:hypothetical protein
LAGAKYKALTYLNLPPDTRKAPGDPITDKELKDAGQSDDDIDALRESGAIGGSTDEINEAHVVPETPPNPMADVNITDGETGGE